MPDPASIVQPFNIPVLNPAQVWFSQPYSRLNNNQVHDAVRLLIFANYGLTAAIEHSDDGSTWPPLWSQANTAGQLLDSGWIAPAKRCFHIKITNGATQQGGDIYANAQFVNPGAIDSRLLLFMQEPATNNDMPNPQKQIASWPYGSFAVTGSVQQLNVLTINAKRRAYLINSTLNQTLTGVTLQPFAAFGLSAFAGFGGEPTNPRPQTIASLPAGVYPAGDSSLVADSILLSFTVGTVPTAGALTVSTLEVL